MLLIACLLLTAATQILSLDNGLGLTPPMGWLTWERFRCVTDCKQYPKECISEDLITRTADIMVDEGYLEAGYEYVGIDDCWLEKERDENGKLVPDRERFPKGMKYIADYLHERGLKFGLYEDYGTKTCAGYPGVYGHEKVDVETFVEWEVDYIKLDGCYINITLMEEGYQYYGKLLNESGRPILYSCSWPAYQEGEMEVDYAAIAKTCNLWRNYDDIDDSYQDVRNISDWFAINQDRLAPYAGPGHFNDPDMLIIGNFGLSVEQSKTQMAIWAILAAPLLISVDLETIRPEFKEILLNREVIAVNQDPLGKQGYRIAYKNKYEVWSRELEGGSRAIAFVSRRTDGVPYYKNFGLEDIKLDSKKKYIVKDLFENVDEKTIDAHTPLKIKIAPQGVRFFKVSEVKMDSDEVNEIPVADIKVAQTIESQNIESQIIESQKIETQNIESQIIESQSASTDNLDSVDGNRMRRFVKYGRPVATVV